MGKLSNEVLRYDPYPTLARFHGSDARVRGVRGPVGSGKTVGCCFEIFLRAQRQEADGDGVRRSRWGVVRGTYPELLTTTIKTWELFFGKWTKIRRQPPIEGVCEFGLGDGTRVRLELWFLALDLPKDEDKLRSADLTAVFLNEASTMGHWVFVKSLERIGRYPRNLSWDGVILDTNSCDDDHWWYRVAEVEKVDGWEFYSQPPALWRLNDYQHRVFMERNVGYPDAWYGKAVRDLEGNWYVPNPYCENWQGQPKGVDYWLGLVGGKSRDYINVFLMNEYGPAGSGKPVYPEYVDSVHCVDVLEAVGDVGLVLGFDYGLTPAMTVSQVMPDGGVRFIDELLVFEHGGMGIGQFQREVVVPYLVDRYEDWLRKGLVQSWGDPAGSIRSQTDTVTCIQVLNNRLLPGRGVDDVIAAVRRGGCDVSLGDLGVVTRPAGTNSFIARREAVANLLNLRIDGAPGFLVSSRCRHLRKGMRGSYCFTRVQAGGDGKYRDVPEKGPYSHICEAAQYACLMGKGVVHDVVGEVRAKKEAAIEAGLDNLSRAAWGELALIREMYDDEDGGLYVTPWGTA